MTTTRRSILLFYMLWLGAFSNNLSAQKAETANYQLLWEITGNGLSEPSYLFGSMHGSEEAIFQFPDSLWVALGRCDALANEVHLDSTMNIFLEKILTEEGWEEEEEEVVQEEPQFSKSDSIKAAAEEDMPALLDAYLMHHAKLQGKRIWGLESIDETLASLTGADMEDFSRLFRQTPQYQEMKKVYSSGSLEEIEKYIQLNEKEFEEDFELTRRNHIQANSIARIIQQQSLFSIVGAAHLPGRQGVIQLLRDQGFQLRSVQATYNFQQHDLPDFYQAAKGWVTQTSPRASYRFQVPQKPQKLSLGGQNTGYLAMDLGTGSFYNVFEINNDIVFCSV